MAATAQSTSTSWVSSLSVLPAKQRLEFQKQITADVAAQAAAPQPAPFSRTYASLREGHGVVPASRREGAPEAVQAAVDGVLDGSSGGASLLPGSSTGAHLAAATRHVPPSTEALLARMIDAAFDVAGVPLPAALTTTQPSLGAAPSRGPATDPLQAAVRDLRLDAPYRHVAARWLGRNLASADGAYAAQAAAGGEATARFAGTAALASGATTAACLAAWEAVQARRKAASSGGGVGGGSSSSSGGGSAPPSGEADDLLDGALDELLA